MTSTRTYLVSTLARAWAASAPLSRQALISSCIALGLLTPASLLAADSQSTADLAPHRPAEAETETEIRIKLHALEDLRADKQPEASAETIAADADADEIRKQAQTRYLASKFKKKEATVRQYVDLAWAEAGKREKLEPELLIAIIQKESAFRPKVQSRYGAQGLMQVVRRWHHDKLQPSESLFDPVVNIRVGADVLEEYLALASGNMDTALRKYSGNARGYVNTIKRESSLLARVAEQAASQVLVARG